VGAIVRNASLRVIFGGVCLRELAPEVIWRLI
jgi:hypothetical protein